MFLGLCTIFGCGGLCVPAIKTETITSSALQSKQSSWCRPPCYVIRDQCICPPHPSWCRPPCYVIRDQCICPHTDTRSAPICCPGCTGWCSGFGCMGHCPYENLIQESCFSLAVQAHGESCKSDCADISNSGCQSCLETSLPDNLFYFILTSA